MRLVCPNCGAQYEVPDGVVPTEGRDVQCSNCGNTWFQVHPDSDTGLADETGVAQAAQTDAQTSLSDDTETELREDEKSSWDSEDASEDEDEWQGFEDDNSTDDLTSEPQADVSGTTEASSDEEEWQGFNDEATQPEASAGNEDDHHSGEGDANHSDTQQDVIQDASEAEASDGSQDWAEAPQSDSDGFDDDADLGETPEETPAAREIDPNVADILRQEAEAETRAREMENTIETQSDLGLDQAGSSEDQRAQEASERMARLRGETPLDEAPLQAAVAATVASASRRDLLPDVEEINSTLRSASDRDDEVTQTYYEDEEVETIRPRGRFRRGFWMAVLTSLVLFLLYIFAPQIVKAVPALEGTMSSYVSMVDNLRSWLDVRVQSLMQWLDTKASASGE